LIPNYSEPFSAYGEAVFDDHDAMHAFVLKLGHAKVCFWPILPYADYFSLSAPMRA